MVNKKNKLLISLLLEMIRIRLVDEKIATEYVHQEMRCPVHLSIGQEAAAIGVCRNLRKEDQIISSHRSHAHYLAKGGSLKKMIAELYGRVTGCCEGRGGSMHLFDKSCNMLSSIPIVASSIPLALGVAMSNKIKNNKCVSLVFFGDGAIEEGVFHESMNFASVHRLPVIFVCENNKYSVYTNLKERQPRRPIEKFALSHNMSVKKLDGFSIEDVYIKAGIVIENVRKKSQPAFIVIDTYRWREHCGPNYDNNIGYRSNKEFNAYKKLDALTKLKNSLLDSKVISKVHLEKEINKINIEIEEAFSFAKKSKLPHKKDIAKNTYAI